MRYSLVTVLLMWVAFAANALQVVSDTGNTVPAYQYMLPPVAVPTLPPVKTMTLASLQTPAPNAFTTGVVTRHRLRNRHLAMLNLFIIGDDALSRRWLRANAKTLAHYHAIGVVDSLAQGDTLATLQSLTALPLVVASLNGLDTLIGTVHYPVLVANGWVVQ